MSKSGGICLWQNVWNAVETRTSTALSDRASLRIKLLSAPALSSPRSFPERSGVMQFDDLIVINPEVRSGKPCITGTRITVDDILEYLASGMSEAEILEDFPSLPREAIKASLMFAANRERQLVSA